jgi:hypothetical protein
VLSLFCLVGLYYLLVRPGDAWHAVAPLIPFSPERTEALRSRFEAVTWSTVVGTGLNAVVQGLLVGGAFALAGVPNAAFWGSVTAVLSVLPLVGSGLVWGPGAASLFITGHVAAGIAIAIWGFVVVANVDNFLRPMVYRRYASMHPMATLVGAVIGVEYFGMVGLVLAARHPVLLRADRDVPRGVWTTFIWRSRHQRSGDQAVVGSIARSLNHRHQIRKGRRVASAAFPVSGSGVRGRRPGLPLLRYGTFGLFAQAPVPLYCLAVSAEKISTRRLSARPSRVLLLAMGWHSP